MEKIVECPLCGAPLGVPLDDLEFGQGGKVKPKKGTPFVRCAECETVIKSPDLLMHNAKQNRSWCQSCLYSYLQDGALLCTHPAVYDQRASSGLAFPHSSYFSRGNACALYERKSAAATVIDACHGILKGILGVKG